MSYQYQDNLPLDARQRYSVKLRLIAMNICPYKVPADTWINDPKNGPIEYHDVYNYLIKHPRIYSAEAMENYRSLEAHIFFVSGWVPTVFHMKIDSGHYVLKADVKPSSRVTEEPHHSWVALSDTGFYLDKNFQLKKTHKYFAQVQMQMHVCNAVFADLVVWTLVDCVIVRVNRDNDLIHEMVQTLQLFWKKHILPELVTRRLELNVQDEFSTKADKENMPSDSTKSYCVCETKTKLDNMVGCDHFDEWFYIKCIGLKCLPTSKTWYCGECRKLVKK